MGGRAASVAALVASSLYLWQALQFPLGTMSAPGAGLYPAGVGAFLVLASGAIVLHGVRRGRRRLAAAPEATAEEDIASAGGGRRVVTAVACLLGFCLLLPWLGYPLLAFLFTTLLLQRLGNGRWATAAAGGVVTAAVSHYVFAVLLGVPLPRGFL
jgi:putative tricarboxylic transport membrane protein